MALARARGCAGRGSPPGRHVRQADASRRRNGPRKATSRRPITVRLRSKSCLTGGSGVPRSGRRVLVAQRLRIPQQANVGTKTRSAGRVPRGGTSGRGFARVDIVFKGRHTSVQERFRQHATVKLAKLERLLYNVIRIDVEVSK